VEVLLVGGIGVATTTSGAECRRWGFLFTCSCDDHDCPTGFVFSPNDLLIILGIFRCLIIVKKMEIFS
jgi:hypothetical protein